MVNDWFAECQRLVEVANAANEATTKQRHRAQEEEARAMFAEDRALKYEQALRDVAVAGSLADARDIASAALDKPMEGK